MVNSISGRANRFVAIALCTRNETTLGWLRAALVGPADLGWAAERRSARMAILHWHRRDLPHFQRDDTQHFITFCTRNRTLLSPPERDIILECCRYPHERTAHIYAVVVMPEHVHLVLSALIINSTPLLLSKILASIKSISARRINKLLGRKGHVWQEESFDHCIRSDEYLNAKMAYVLSNPVRKGLVKKPRDYHWLWTADPLFMENFSTE